MFMGAYYALLPCILWGIGNFCVCISAWASGVARSTELGNAKASQRGTGDGMDSHAFFVYKTKQFINRYIWEATAQMLLYEALLLILFSVGIRTISVHEFFGILYRGNNSRDCLL